MEIQSVNDNAIIRQRPTEVKATGQDEHPSGEIHQQQQQQPESNYTKSEINKEVGHLNKWLGSTNSHLHFVMHDKLNEYYVQVVDDRTNEVIKEIPSKKVMDMIANFYEKLGIIVDKKI